MEIPKTILLFVLFGFAGCRPNINDPSKRNENWAWWVDKDTGVGKWIPIGEEAVGLDGEATYFCTNGKVFCRQRFKDGQLTDTSFDYNYDGVVIRYSVISKDTLVYYPINGDYVSRYQNGNAMEVGVVENHKLGNKWVTYYKNGKIKTNRSWINGEGW